MLKRSERMMKVYSPTDGEPEFLGHYPVSMSYRTSEEVAAEDMLYTNLRLSVYADRCRSPEGGYRRGMVLESDDGKERYTVLVPVIAGRTWILKTERVMFVGDGVSPQ